MKDINQQKAEIGIKVVLDYLKSQGKKPINVSTNREHKGYDILLNNEKIEVKCSSKHKGIPDCFGSEFDENNNLVANFLYIVRIKDMKPYEIQILSKEEFNRYSKLHNKKTIIKISNKLKTDLEKNKIGNSIKI